jgi:hypothetical protein
MPGLKSYLTRHSKVLAVAGSLILHIAAVVMLIMPSSGALSELDTRIAGNENVEGIDVSLFQSADQAAAPPPDMAGQFAPMLETMADDSWPPSNTPKPSQSLADIFGEARAEQQPQAQTASPSDTQALVSVDGHKSKTMNDLWKAIEPCWRRVADKNTVSVTLSVSFSPLGNLSKPPQIVRETGASLNDKRLRSESLAITALAQCGPYLMAFGQSDVSVRFPGTGSKG